MYRGWTKLPLLCVLAGALAFTGCSKDDSQMEELQAARIEALAEIETAKTAVDAKRSELAQLLESIANPEEPAEGAEPVDVAALEEQAKTLKNDVDSLADDLGGKIAVFINEDPPAVGEPLTETMQKAVDIKVDEDILLAQEYIQEGGDYRRAISILEQIEPLAKDNERLMAELEKARTDRWMTEERFAAVEKGFDEAQVREALGPVNLRNVKEYPDRGVTAWFYLKESGGAAAVYFREKKGKLEAYKVDFEAVKTEDDEAGDDA